MDIAGVQDPGDIVDFFENNHLEKGDTLKLLAESENKGTLVLVIAIVVVLLLKYLYDSYKLDKQKGGEKILDDLFKGKSVEEIEAQVEQEYGVKIAVEIKKAGKEHEDWNSLAMKSLEKMYADDEPDYNDVQVQEPNPDYKP